MLPDKAVCGFCLTFILLYCLGGLSFDLISLFVDNAGPDKRGHVVEWVEKASFPRLNKLFEISAAERHHETLLTARNLLAVVREPQMYIINILPRKLPKKVVPGEHYVLKDLLFYKEVRETDAQKRQARLDDREGRGKRELCGRPPVKNAPHPLFLLAPQRRRTRRS